ncbi:DNA/RNA non-specific endonuclease [Sulfurimonas indica]|uniref:DNA/RNA non-specific endonuclease n=1 Tax=Sulfurimonas TaxID=202746 RepID=UPI00165EEB0F|nr:DNA/RNA non-specific endonuclease [Sulfurimonas indica]
MIKKITTALLLAVSLFGFESKYLPNIDIDTKCSKILHKSAMDICYSYKWKAPKLAVYSITAQDMKKHHYKRKGLTFKPDYQVPIKYRSYTRDYSHTGFDRGHNAPNAAFSYDRKLQKETFLLSNISPQKPQLNRRLWAKIERFARMQASWHGKVNVVNGTCGSLGHIRNGVNIPAYWYKIIFLPSGKTVSFLSPNTNNGMSKAKIKDYMSSLDEIKNRCNIGFDLR